MRITGGVLKGRQVKPVPGIVRPAMDRMRESVFACLGELAGMSFLDLFSGTGVISLEAASRGASYIEAVEADFKKNKFLIENLKISPVRVNCRFMSVELYVKRAKSCFDMIFCDPPFPYRYKEELVNSIASSKLMKKDSLLLLHRPREEEICGIIPFLIKKETREYGRSVVDFFKIEKIEAVPKCQILEQP